MGTKKSPSERGKRGRIAPGRTEGNKIRLRECIFKTKGGDNLDPKKRISKCWQHLAPKKKPTKHHANEGVAKMCLTKCKETPKTPEKNNKDTRKGSSLAVVEVANSNSENSKYSDNGGRGGGLERLQG